MREKIRLSRGRPLSQAERYIERGLDFYAKGQFERALADLDEALRLEKRNAEFLATRGYILQEAGYPDEAEEDFEAALKRDPTQWIVHFARAVRAFNQGEYDTALDHITKGQRIVPQRSEFILYRTAIHFANKDKSAAEREIAGISDLASGDSKVAKMARKWKAAVKKM